MNLAQFRATFPRMAEIGTGGNCTALAIDIGSIAYVLVTDGDASVPDETTTHVYVSLHLHEADHGEPEAHCDFATFDKAADLIMRWDSQLWNGESYRSVIE